MASSAVVILSSSPPRQFNSYTMSSSPLPSPSELFQRRPTLLRTGSNATPIPSHVSASFTTASSLLRRASTDGSISGADIFDIPDEEPPGPARVPKTSIKRDHIAEGKVAKVRKAPDKMATSDNEAVVKKSRKSRAKPKSNENTRVEYGSKEKAPRKPRAKKVEVADQTGAMKEKSPRKSTAKKVVTLDDGSVEEKAPRKPRAKKIAGDTTGDVPPKEKAVRKPRAKKGDSVQAKLPPALVTKSTSSSKDEDAGHGRVSKYFGGVDDNSARDIMDFGLEEAVKRRSAWTPPPSKGYADIPSLDTPVTGDLLTEVLDDVESSEKHGNGFTDLLGSFGFNNLAEPCVDPRSHTEGGGIRKRKLIELVQPNLNGSTSATKSTSPTKSKAPKKKARTLTELAPSAYAEPVPEEPAPILQYFSVKTTERTTKVTKDGFTVPGKPRSKGPVKRTGKGTANAPILLSPESALKHVTNQDFVFGTSSQLAREESPSLLKDLHAAMQASNEANECDPFASSLVLPTSHLATSTRIVKRNLWSAASRDDSGDLLDVEVIDMVHTPAPKRVLESSIVKPSAPTARVSEVDMVPVPIKAVQTNPIDTMTAAQDQCPQSPLRRVLSGLSLSKATEAPSKISVQRKSSKKSPKASSRAPKALQMPNFEAYTDIELTKKIDGYGFKRVKQRSKMIALLVSIWEQQHPRPPLGALGTNAIIGSSPEKSSQLSSTKLPASDQGLSPKKPRGRPRKDSATSSPAKPKPSMVTTVEYLEMDSDTPLSRIGTPNKSKKGKMLAEEISDSEAERSSPPRRSQARTPLKLNRPNRSRSRSMSPNSAQIHLFKQITLAVTSAPPTSDPKNPSWHEKILLYDPIVLEDLTVWLNTEALGKVNWDGEVDPKEVKKWCESKGICCLWRENLRGGARSRY